MGSGKSTIAELLSKELNLELFEQDDIIRDSSGYDSISKIFKEKGEDYFRDLETKVLKDIFTKDNFSLSTGGGIIMREENREIIKNSNSKVVFIETDFETSAKRCLGKNIPLFQDSDKAFELYQYRKPIYQELADITVQNVDISPEETKNKVLELLDLT
ncbi:UNVERIFIED_CONTAM: hypothetical protein GTU68_006115 [Idotea baltica]|nr:hypothetical protein [Idotea baltica]